MKKNHRLSTAAISAMSILGLLLGSSTESFGDSAPDGSINATAGCIAWALPPNAADPLIASGSLPLSLPVASASCTGETESPFACYVGRGGHGSVVTPTANAQSTGLVEVAPDGKAIISVVAKGQAQSGSCYQIAIGTNDSADQSGGTITIPILDYKDFYFSTGSTSASASVVSTTDMASASATITVVATGGYPDYGAPETWNPGEYGFTCSYEIQQVAPNPPIVSDTCSSYNGWMVWGSLQVTFQAIVNGQTGSGVDANGYYFATGATVQAFGNWTVGVEPHIDY
jgi:hypothetical protein